MQATEEPTRQSFAVFQATSRRQARAPSAHSAATDGGNGGNPSVGGLRRSASATLQQPAGRVKLLWEDPSAPTRSRSAGRPSASSKAAGKRRDKRSPRSNGPPKAKQKPAGLPQAARTLIQQVVEWDATLKAAATNSSAEPDAETEALQSAFRSACADLLTSYPGAAKKLDVDRRLWKSWHRRFKPLDDPDSRSALDNCSRSYLELVARLEAQNKNANASKDTREALRLSLQHSLVALGDVERYRQQPTVSPELDAWTDVIQFYQRARDMVSESGKPYNQLALVAARRSKLLEAASLYARSLGCQYPFPSRENLMHSLKWGGTQPPLYLQRAPDSYQLVGMRAVGVLRKLSVVAARDVALKSWGESLAEVQDTTKWLLSVKDILNDEEYREELMATLLQIVIVNLFLIYDAQSGGDVVAIARDRLDFNTSGLAELCALDLLFTIGASLLQQLTAFLRATSDYRQLQTVGNALLPGINALLQWLHLQDWPKSSRSGAVDGFYTSCTDFHFALPSSSSAVYLLGLSPGRDEDLPEDLEVKGFLPLDYARERYVETFPAPPTQPPLTKRRSSRGRVDLPSSSSKKAFEVRMARAVGLCNLLVLKGSSGRLAKPLRTGPSTRKKPADIDRLCLQCSNSSTFDGGACEFCGFEDDSFETSGDSEEDGEDDVELTAQHLRRVNLDNEAAGRLNSNEVAGGQQEADPSSFAVVMAIGAQYSEFQRGFQSEPAPSSRPRGKCLIVLDAPNIAMRHGKNQQFSSRGVRLAVDYFTALGHRVVAFIPDYMLKDEQEQLGERRNQPKEDASANVCKIPDDIALLRAMVQQGELVPTPPQDYDDSYCIQYAGLHDGCVVTNDLFRDHVMNMEGPRERKEAMRAWLKAHQISFTWVRDEFLPNPDFRFPA